MGETPATKAKATASGIIARLTAKPLRAFFAADSGLNGFNALRGPSGVKSSSGAFATKSSSLEISATAAARRVVFAVDGRRSTTRGTRRALLVATRPRRACIINEHVMMAMLLWSCGGVNSTLGLGGGHPLHACTTMLWQPGVDGAAAGVWQLGAASGKGNGNLKPSVSTNRKTVVLHVFRRRPTVVLPDSK